MMLQYMTVKELAYGRMMREEKELELETMLRDERVRIEARRRHGRSEERNCVMGHKCDMEPRFWIFSVNGGEASIRFLDAPAGITTNSDSFVILI